ncbi:MAG: type IX secretion system membrane protein PorP/SprF [Cryomorphaceae bacterium]|nr:type IX secretion system membrane protein PorP/SprF [Cryomorphaceae bacterium]
MSNPSELDVDRDMWELSKVDNFEVNYPHADKIFRRRPVGLFMSMGMASIAGIIALGTAMYWPSTSNQTNTIFTPQTELATSTEQINVTTSEKQTPINATRNVETVTTIPSSIDQEVFPQNIQRQALNERGEETSLANVSGQMVQMSNSPIVVTDEYSTPSAISQDAIVETSPENQVNQEKEPVLITVNNETIISTQDLVVEDVNVAQGLVLNESVIEQDAKTTSTSTSTSRTTPTHSVYKESFSSKLRQAGRAVSRMLDNPVALKNLKDPHYHIPGMQPTEVNFGAVGTLLATRVQTMSRLQWAGQANQQFINSISVDGYSYGMRGGLGLQVSHSLYANGGIQNIHSSFTYSPKFSVSRNVIVEPSLRFIMGNKTIDPTKIQTGSMVEMERLNPHQFYTVGQMPIGRSLWYRDLGLGLSVNTRWFYASVQGNNLLKHTDNIYSSDLTDIRRSGQHFIATIGTDYETRRENFGASPYLVYQQYEKLKEAWLGVNLRYQWITVGGAISSQLDPAVSLGIKFNHVMLAYNADLTHSEVLGKQFLSHQLTIRILTKPSRMGQRLLNL